MKSFPFKKYFKIFIDIRFAILILAILAFTSSLGSFIEQDQNLIFYQTMYPSENRIYGFIDWKFITLLGIDHIYSTSWFFILLLVLAISLISCTITRQFPIVVNAKQFLFKKKKESFSTLNFFVQLKSVPYLKEILLNKIQGLGFYTYQKKNLIYAYQGLIGRIGPILVHFSLITILLGCFLGAFKNFKAQESLPKGEIVHIQNTLGIGAFTNLPSFNIRVNDFWVEYENNRVHQFYSNLSLLDNFGNEVKNQSVSVNHPLKYKSIDIYQSDWNLLGIRVKNQKENKIYEIPLFPLKKNTKSWVSWIPINGQEWGQTQGKELGKDLNFLTLIFDQFENIFFVYTSQGEFLGIKNVGDFVFENLKLVEIIPSTGLLIKYDPMISLIYFGFGLLMLTTFLSYFPYTQIWVFKKEKVIFLGSTTNRGKIKVELEFENLLQNCYRHINKYR